MKTNLAPIQIGSIIVCMDRKATLDFPFPLMRFVICIRFLSNLLVDKKDPRSFVDCGKILKSLQPV